MELLGIGLPELFFIVLIALVLLGPRDMQKAGRTIGTWLRKVVTSPGWNVFQRTSREIRNLPNRLMREAGLEEMAQFKRDVAQAARPTLSVEQQAFRSPVPPPAPGGPPAPENVIAPPPGDTHD